MRSYDYIFVASTDEGEDVEDSTKNEIPFDDRIINVCGITNAHSFPIIDTVPLYSRGRKRIEHMLYMLRDPTGPESIQNPVTRWNKHDKASWSDNYRF
jgi:hypothetical protein